MSLVQACEADKKGIDILKCAKTPELITTESIEESN